MKRPQRAREEAAERERRFEELDPVEFERQLLEASRRPRTYNDGITIVDAWLEGSYPDTALITVFRDPRRPDCRFGWRTYFWHHTRAWHGEAEAADLDIGFMEYFGKGSKHFAALPCEPDRLTWITPPEPPPTRGPDWAIEERAEWEQEVLQQLEAHLVATRTPGRTLEGVRLEGEYPGTRAVVRIDGLDNTIRLYGRVCETGEPRRLRAPDAVARIIGGFVGHAP